MKPWYEFYWNHKYRSNLFLIAAGSSLVISFFNIGNLPVDLAWVAIVLCGLPIIVEALKRLIQEFDIKADVLVSIALIASVAIGEIFAAGEVAFIMTVGAMLEERTVAKARMGIEKLVHLTPRTARVVREGQETVIAAEQVRIGDILLVLAGETIPVDGRILSGQTSINQAVMTGESLPVDKGEGDTVSSGTVNLYGTFKMEATKVDQDSSLQRMIRLVESADASKAKIVGIADRWATWIVVIALSSAIVTWLVTGEILRSVTILVVFCPCALVLATPTAIMAGIGNATKYGILIREGDALERLSKVELIAFDKTGTITYGEPAVIGVESVHQNLSPETVLSLTAAAELRSEHPLGKAILAHYKEVSSAPLSEPTQFEMLAGRGVMAKVENRIIRAGNADMLKEHAVVLPAGMMERANVFQEEGCTIIYIGVDEVGAGFIALSDTIREDAVSMIQDLKKIGVDSILLTGDNLHAASHMAKLVGIAHTYPDCLPEDKMNVIEDYQNKGKMVCMVGDGVNDALALKRAYVGIAMGGIGSDIAVEAADIALVRDDIKCMVHLVQLSQKMMKTIKLNLILSMTLNFGAIILAVTGILNPVVGALVHNVGSVVVIINSALLLNWKKKRKAID